VGGESDFIRERFTEKDNGVMREVDFPIAERIRRHGGLLRMKVTELDEHDGLELYADGVPLTIRSRGLFVSAYRYPYLFGREAGRGSPGFSWVAESSWIVERDLISADLRIVPAGPPRDLGIDRSMILSYGQDDRSCAYTSRSTPCHPRLYTLL
jgi:hypothetical protein